MGFQSLFCIYDVYTFDKHCSTNDICDLLEGVINFQNQSKTVQTNTTICNCKVGMYLTHVSKYEYQYEYNNFFFPVSMS